MSRDGKYDETRDWFFQNVRLMKALTEKGYDVNYTWGIGRHGQKQSRISSYSPSRIRPRLSFRPSCKKIRIGFFSLFRTISG